MEVGELEEWAAYFQYDPWTGERADHRAAMIAYTLAMCNYARGRKPEFDDFIVHKKPDNGKQSIKDMRGVMLAAVKQHGAKRPKS